MPLALHRVRAFPALRSLKRQPALAALALALHACWLEWALVALDWVPFPPHTRPPYLSGLLASLRTTLPAVPVAAWLCDVLARIPRALESRRVRLQRVLPGGEHARRVPLLEQLARQVKPSEMLPPVWRLPLRVEWAGETAHDTGGLYAEALALLAAELEAEGSPLLLQAPGGTVWLLREDASLERCRLLGRLLGQALVARVSFPLTLASSIWKALTGEIVGRDDLRQADGALAKALDALSADDALTVASLERDWLRWTDERWTAPLASGRRLELRPHGASERVTFAERRAWAQSVEKARLAEAADAVAALREGFAAVVPLGPFQLAGWRLLERLVTGDVLDLVRLQAHTDYRGYSTDSSEVRVFWAAWAGLERPAQHRVLRFVTGRERLPPDSAWPITQRLLIAPVDAEATPTAAVCFWQLNWPRLLSEEKARDALLKLGDAMGFT
jgi:hypothetical protein